MNSEKKVYYSSHQLSFATFHIASTDQGLATLVIDDKDKFNNWLKKHLPNHELIRTENHHTDIITQLEEYFAGQRYSFQLDLNFQGTAFQKKVWRQLANIPYGETITYKELAIKVGGPNYARAVGGANNKNPLPIVIPCHRVIGSNGKLTGYAGGLDIKEQLLKLEKANL